MDEKYSYYSDVLIEKALKDKLSLKATGRLTGDFLIAGYDTSSATISHALLLLAMHPEQQEAAYQEQLHILGDDPEIVPTWEQLSKMEHLTRILKEVMRLNSPPNIFRKLTKDIDLGEYKLPEGTTAIISFITLHRNPNFWSHPNEFYPDHFLPEECAKRPKDCYFPFSWGPRACPGSVYAMVLNKILISTVIRRYKLETDLKFDEIEFKYSLLLEVSQGYPIKIKQRTSSNSS
uniref:Uncharacterized protein n=2 Tax=Rhodnius prolixus TaxID=13249 RepID=T1HV83_RHOPR